MTDQKKITVELTVDEAEAAAFASNDAAEATDKTLLQHHHTGEFKEVLIEAQRNYEQAGKKLDEAVKRAKS